MRERHASKEDEDEEEDEEEEEEKEAEEVGEILTVSKSESRRLFEAVLTGRFHRICRVAARCAREFDHGNTIACIFVEVITGEGRESGEWS